LTQHAVIERPRAALDLVLDTNVVLDWLAFRHPVGTPIEEALTSGQCRWLCTRPMRDELARVVVRESLERWAIDAHAVLAVFDALAVDMGVPPPLGAADCLRCTDPDDQMFIDVAIARRAHALLTRDRAVPPGVPSAPLRRTDRHARGVAAASPNQTGPMPAVTCALLAPGDASQRLACDAADDTRRATNSTGTWAELLPSVCMTNRSSSPASRPR